jgi:hypothetical protein
MAGRKDDQRLPVDCGGWVLVPWPVASEFAVPTAEVPVGVALVVPAAPVPDVPMVPDSEVPVAEVPVELEPELLLDIAPEEALSLELVPVELHAARLIAIRPPIRRAWYFFIIHSCCKSDAIMGAHLTVRNRIISYRRVGLGARSLQFVAMRLLVC